MPQARTDAPRVIVTGVAGFIGSHVGRALLSRGVGVVGVDNLDPFYDAGLKHRNIMDLQACAGECSAPFEFHQADITDRGAMRQLFDRVRPGGVIHLAAKAGVRPSIADPEAYYHTNVVGTSVVLEEARASGASRVVVASSSSVYGNASRVPFREDDGAVQPISPYAASKRACELLAHTHHHLYKTPIACLRFFTVFGPGQRPDLAIAQFLSRVARGEVIRLFGDGTSSRDYTYIDDIVAGVLAAYDRIPGHGLRTWNLGGNHPVSLDEMVSAIERITGNKAKIERLPMQAGDVERTYADLARSRAELGYEPRIGLEEGLRRQWAWMREPNGGGSCARASSPLH